jgi:tetratricopeptide (TPR) repeat protein
LLLLDYWPLERMRGRRTEDRGRKTAGRLIAEKIPLLVLSAFLAVATVIAQQGGGAVIALETVSLEYRIANMFVSYIRYIGKMMWPSGLAVLYPYPHVGVSNAIVITCATLFALMSVFSIYICRRRKYATVGWLWYVVTLVPMIGLVQSGGQAMANRYMYISMLGLLIIVALAAKDLVANDRSRRIVTPVFVPAAAAAMIAMTLATRNEAGYWRDSPAMYERTIAATENNYITHYHYGLYLCTEGRYEEGIGQFKESLRISPGYLLPRKYICITLYKQKKFDEAISCLTEALQERNDWPDIQEMYAELGLAYEQKNDLAGAEINYSKALTIKPDYGLARNNLGMIFVKEGKLNEAIECFNKLLQQDKDSAELNYNLAMALSRQNRYDDAIKHLARVLELQPQNADVLNSLAWLLVTRDEVSAENADKAIELARRACELTQHKNPRYLDTLAAAYAASGKFEDAVKTAEHAVTIAQTRGQEDLAGEIQSRIELYRAGRPYQQK